MQHDFANKLIIITGGASGIGKALARRFATAGAAVAILDLQEGAARASAAGLALSGATVTGHACDVTDEASVDVAISAAKKAHGKPVYGLVNNAGISHRSMFAETDTAVLKSVIDVSLLGSIHCTKAVVDDIRQQGGAIGALSSVAGVGPLYGRTGYAAAKHAVQGFFGSLKAELDEDGVSVTIACPSFVETPIVTSALGGDGKPVQQSLHRVGKPQLPEEVAEAIFNGMRNGKRLVLPSRTAKLAWHSSRLFPNFYLKQMRKKILPEFRDTRDS